MSEGAHAATDHGNMDVHEQKDTFHHFVSFGLWITLLIIMSVALLTVALAMGLGWLAGVGVYFVIGAAAGFGARLGASWWATLIATTLLLGVGGLIVSLVI